MRTYILLWIPMLLIAILNGVLREFVFTKYLNVLSAKQLSTITLLIFFSIYIGLVLIRYRPTSTSQALFIGLTWMIMTLVFETVFGAYRGNSIGNMLQEYNILKGNIWLLIPLLLGVAPLLYYKLFSAN